MLKNKAQIARETPAESGRFRARNVREGIIIFCHQKAPHAAQCRCCAQSVPVVPGGGGHFHIEGDGDVPLDRV